MDFDRVKETESRFEARERARKRKMSKVDKGDLLRADEPKRVEARLRRLGADERTVSLYERGDYASRPSISAIPELVETVNPLERILGNNDLIGIDFLEKGLAIAQCIGRIRIRSSSGRFMGFGTGFMVSPDLLLTNNHVLKSSEPATGSEVEFGYQESFTGAPIRSVVFRFDPQRFFFTDKKLDFTMVAVEPRSTSGAEEVVSFGCTGLIEESGKALVGEFVNIIQHPNGELKQVAIRENQIADVFEDFVHYQTDTAPGSSGSPVLNDQWEVVALHHSGVPRRENGRIMSTAGTPWTPDMGDHRIHWIANEGIRISRIVKHLKKRIRSKSQKELFEKIFVSGPCPAETVFPRASSRPEQDQPEPVRHIEDVTGSIVSQGLSIPLELTVQLRHAPLTSGTLATASAAPTQSAVTPSSSVSSADEPPGDPSPDEARISSLISELDEARTGPYYDAEEDEQLRTAYYEDLSHELVGSELFFALSHLLRTTHRNRLGYSPSRHLYPSVDLQPDGMLRSVYSDKVYDPERMIREAFRVEQERMERIRELTSREAGLTFEELTLEMEALEAQLPYNCEHVVPQSWFNRRQPMRGDLHHLFTCEMECNSYRSNCPYFDYPDFEESIRDACGKRESDGFEPTAGKGLVARATLYFLLRYPGEIDDETGEFTADRLAVLLDWHRQHPVTEHERHRNMIIHEKQGNRNPLIDFDDWAEKIDFKLGFG